MWNVSCWSLLLEVSKCVLQIQKILQVQVYKKKLKCSQIFKYSFFLKCWILFSLQKHRVARTQSQIMNHNLESGWSTCITSLR